MSFPVISRSSLSFILRYTFLGCGSCLNIFYFSFLLFRRNGLSFFFNAAFLLFFRLFFLVESYVLVSIPFHNYHIIDMYIVVMIIILMCMDVGGGGKKPKKNPTNHKKKQREKCCREKKCVFSFCKMHQ